MFNKIKQLFGIKTSFDANSNSEDAQMAFDGADTSSLNVTLDLSTRQQISSRAREEINNNSYCYGMINTLATDTIGSGARIQIQGNHEKEVVFQNWIKEIKLFKKLAIARKTKAVDGECFLLLHKNTKLKSPIKLDIQIISTERIGSPSLVSSLDYYPTGELKENDGILYDKMGNITHYRLLTTHPSETMFNPQSSKLISAEYMIQYANIIRPDQTRGVSEIVASLMVFNDLRRYSNAVLQCAESAASFSVIAKTNQVALDEDGQSDFTGVKSGSTIKLQRGKMTFLPEGYDVSQLKAEQPTSTYPDYIKCKIREASRPLSMPLNVAMCDSSGYNYSSGRLDHQTYFKQLKVERETIQVDILDVLYDKFNLLYSAITFNNNPEETHSWLWSGMEAIDPKKEAEAQNIRLNVAGTSTLAIECGDKGLDWQEVAKQRAIEQNYMKELGLVPLNQTTETSNTSDDGEIEE